MKKVWKKITVNTNTEGSELVADAFFSIGCNGVEIIDKNDILEMIQNGKNWDYVDEKLLDLSDTVKVSGFVSTDKLTLKTKELQNILQRYENIGETTVTDVDDEIWYENWKKHYKPIIAGGFVIVPEWLKYPNEKNLTEIRIDPGMAFGTGEHESTKMCLTLMSDLDFNGKKVVDVGCGSGILGIGAIKKNAAECYMCDIDSVAVKAARKNAQLNGIENAQIELADLLENKNIKGDIILTNLTADILIRLAKDIKNHIAKGGIIIQSGIIADRLEQVKNAYIEQGFNIIKELSLGEWRAVMAEVK